MGTSVIKYFKNFTPGAKPFWTTTSAEAAFKLQVRGAVFDTGAVIGDATWHASGETVTWKPKVLGANVTGPWGRLTRGSRATGAWDAASYTTRAIASGDGYVEFTVPDTRKTLRLGLGAPYAGTNVNKLGFHLYVPSLETTFGDLFVVELTPDGQSATYRSVGSYRARDTFRVGGENGYVAYRRNGSLSINRRRASIRASTHWPSIHLCSAWVPASIMYGCMGR